MASAGGSCQEMEPAGDFAARARHRPDASRNEQSSPARNALSCHPPEIRLHPCTARAAIRTERRRVPLIPLEDVAELPSVGDLKGHDKRVVPACERCFRARRGRLTRDPKSVFAIRVVLA
jgi:hypothetical protein